MKISSTIEAAPSSARCCGPAYLGPRNGSAHSNSVTSFSMHGRHVMSHSSGRGVEPGRLTITRSRRDSADDVEQILIGTA